MASLSQYIQTNYPSPNDGDVFLWGGVRYTYDATPGAWVGSIPDPSAVQDVATGTQPTNPITGELWYDPSVNRLKMYNGTEFVDTNPRATASELGLNRTVAVQDSGTEVNATAGVLNFTGSLTASMNSDTTVDIGSDVPALPTNAESYVLNVPSTGDPTWQDIGTAAGGIELNDLDGVAAPNNTPAGRLLVSNGSGFEVMTFQAANVAEGNDLDATKTRLTAAENNITGNDADISGLTNRMTTAEGNITSVTGDVNGLNLSDLGDVSTSGVVKDNVLAYNGSEWVPTTPQAGSGVNQVSVSNSGKTITVAGTANDIPTITAATLNGTTLNLTTNGSAADLTTDLSSLSSASFNLTVDGTANQNNIDFSDDFTVSSSSGTSTVTIPGLATNTTNISNLTSRVTDLENQDIPAAITVRDDGTTVDDNTSVIDFVGGTVTARGGGRVEVSLSGGSSSAAVNQTAFDRSSERSDKTQFHVNGGTNGGKFRIIIKNNSATANHNIRYTFGSDQMGSAADNLAAGVTYGDLPGLWDSDHTTGRFIFFPPNTGGSVDWPVNTNTALSSRDIIQLEVDIQPSGRMDFFTSNATDVIWQVASIGGFVDTGSGAASGGGSTPATEDPGPNYATGTPAVAPVRGPFYINRPVSHYNMTWRSGSAADIRLDQIMGGTGSAQTGGRDFYRLADTSENQGLWMVAYYTTGGALNDNSSIGWGVLMPGTSGDSGTQGDLDTINQHITSTSLSNATSVSFNTTSALDTNPDLNGQGPNGFTNALINTYGPNLGSYGDAQAYTSWTGANNWMSVQSAYFYLPASGGRAVELRRGNIRDVRQSPANTAARIGIYELLFRIYSPA